jgi:hypothetical protein
MWLSDVCHFSYFDYYGITFDQLVPAGDHNPKC